MHESNERVTVRPTLRDFGPVDAPLYLLARLLRRVPGRRARLLKYRYWAQPVPPARLMPARAGAISIRPLVRGDAELTQLPRTPELVAQRFANGDVCLGAIRQGRVLASMWLATGRYQEDEVRAWFEPQPVGQAAWDYDIFILPEERGGLLFVRLWDAAYDLLRQRGCRCTVSRISAFNLASSASQARMGGRPIGWGVFLILFNWQLMVSSVAPRLHLARPGGRGPVLRLETGSVMSGRAAAR